MCWESCSVSVTHAECHIAASNAEVSDSLEYFYPHRISAALPTEVWPSFQDETWLVPIANAHALRETDIEQETPEGLVNRGPLSMADYNDQVAHAKAYLGIGRPDISPSPYLAL